jgi:hypothetical protein
VTEDQAMRRPLITAQANVDRPGVTIHCSRSGGAAQVALRVEFALGDHADALAALDRAYQEAVAQINQARSAADR